MYLWTGSGEEGTALGWNGTVQPVTIDWYNRATEITDLPDLPGTDKGSVAFS